MGNTIIKLRPGLDLYMVWSSVVDNAVALGDEEEIRGFWENERSFFGACTPYTDRQWDEIMARVHCYGTSASPWKASWHPARRPAREGGWRDNGMVVMNGPEGWLQRRHFLPYAVALRDNKMHKATRLVRPFEDQARELAKMRHIHQMYRRRRG